MRLPFWQSKAHATAVAGGADHRWRSSSLENDILAKQVTSMLSSLESVKSICDPSYMSREECLEGMENGELLAAPLIPGGALSRTSMSGVNTPVPVLLPENAGVESRIFKELADAGAQTLSAAQAGIYAGDEVLDRFHCSEARAQLERDLNRLYLEYSLPRGELFRKTAVSASGDVKPVVFYAISLFILALMLSAIPVSGFLLPQNPVLRRQLLLAGVGPVSMILSRILGLALLYMILLLSAASAAVLTGAIPFSSALPAALLLLSVSAASLAVCAFQAAGNRMGGVLFCSWEPQRCTLFRRDPAPGVPSPLPSRRRPRSFRPIFSLRL
ncbi:MAG: ABC transporter permease [Clostridium sp.]